jgi:hypothetical protein
MNPKLLFQCNLFQGIKNINTNYSTNMKTRAKKNKKRPFEALIIFTFQNSHQSAHCKIDFSCQPVTLFIIQIRCRGIGEQILLNLPNLLLELKNIIL